MIAGGGGEEGVGGLGSNGIIGTSNHHHGGLAEFFKVTRLASAKVPDCTSRVAFPLPKSVTPGPLKTGVFHRAMAVFSGNFSSNVTMVPTGN